MGDYSIAVKKTALPDFLHSIQLLNTISPQQQMPKKPLSPDTSLEAEAVQLELLRKATPQQRFALCRSLSSMVALSSYRAIRQAHPELSAREADVKFVELHYGKKLAEGVRQCLKDRGEL